MKGYKNKARLIADIVYLVIVLLAVISQIIIAAKGVDFKYTLIPVLIMVIARCVVCGVVSYKEKDEE